MPEAEQSLFMGIIPGIMILGMILQQIVLHRKGVPA